MICLPQPIQPILSIINGKRPRSQISSGRKFGGGFISHKRPRVHISSRFILSMLTETFWIGLPWGDCAHNYRVTNIFYCFQSVQSWLRCLWSIFSRKIQFLFLDFVLNKNSLKSIRILPSVRLSVCASVMRDLLRNSWSYRRKIRSEYVVCQTLYV